MSPQNDVMIDITVPPSQDTQACGLRVLQYHAILGNAVAQRSKVLEGNQDGLQEFLLGVVLPQLRQVNIDSTYQYYRLLRAEMNSQAWEMEPKQFRT